MCRVDANGDWEMHSVIRKKEFMKFGRMAALLLTALSVWACASVWKRPEVTLGKIELAGGKVFDQHLKLKLKVRNPNDRDIPVEKLRFQLLIAGKSYVSGQSRESVTIPHQGEAELDVEASLQLASLLRNLPAIKGDDGRLHYRLNGDVVVVGYGSVPFDQPGVIELGAFERLFAR